MAGYWNAHSDRDWQDECGMYDASPRQRIQRAERSLNTNIFGEPIMAECDCGAPTNGKWANIHSAHCAANYIDDLEARIHAIAVKHCIALPEPVVREMVAYLLEGIR
jgi:hypothetical protein